MSQEIDLTKLDVAVLRLIAGDQVVFKFPGHISPSAKAHIQKQWKRICADNPAIILDGGLDIEVLRKEGDANRT